MFTLKKDDVNPLMLADIQRAGEQGDLAAFWRGFIQQIAASLDKQGTDAIRLQLQTQLRQDDEALLSHQRTVGALRQNRVAWLILSNWLHRAGHITQDEAARLNAAHLDARRLLAQEQHATQQEERPATIFLDVIRELLATGEAVLEDEHAPVDNTDDGQGTLPILPERILGFHYNGMIALHPSKAYSMVQKRLGPRAFQYSQAAINQQLLSDGLIAATDEKAKKIPKGVWWNGATRRVLLLWPQALEAAGNDPPDDPPLTPLTHITPSYTTGVMQNSALESAATQPLTPLTPIQRDDYINGSAEAQQAAESVNDPLSPAPRCKDARNGDPAHHKAINGITPETPEMCNGHHSNDDEVQIDVALLAKAAASWRQFGDGGARTTLVLGGVELHQLEPALEAVRRHAGGAG